MTDRPKTLREIMEAAARRHGDGVKPATGRRLGEIADAHGWPITHTTINHLLGGTYTSRPSRRTLDAVANLAGIDPRRVYEIAGRKYQAPFAEQLPPDVDELTPDQRKAVIAVIRAMLVAQERAEAELRPAALRRAAADSERVPESVIQRKRREARENSDDVTEKALTYFLEMQRQQRHQA